MRDIEEAFGGSSLKIEIDFEAISKRKGFWNGVLGGPEDGRESYKV